MRHRKQQLAGEKLRKLDRRCFGARNGRAKLNAVRVKAIREAADTGRWSQSALAEIQGVARTAIGDIIRGTTWNPEGTASRELSCTEALWRLSSAPSSSNSSPTGKGRATSPYLLLHEHPVTLAQPWRVLLACALCNRSRGRRSLPILLDLVRRWPRAEDLAEAEVDGLARVLRPLGVHRVRAERIIAMCVAIVHQRVHMFPQRFPDVRHLPGVGVYAQDAWSLFVFNRIDIEPQDRELSKWVHWARSAAS